MKNFPYALNCQFQLLILFFLCCFIVPSLAQDSNYASDWVKKMNLELTAGRHLAAAGYASKAADIYQSDAETGLAFRKQENFSKAIQYYLYAADFYQKAYEKYKSTSILDLKEERLKKAREIYSIMKAQDIKLWSSADIDHSLLDPQKPLPKEETHEEIKFENNLIGERLYLRTPDKVFSLNLYKPFVIDKEENNQRQLARSKYTKMLENHQRVDKETLQEMSNFHHYQFKGELGGLLFFREEIKGDPKYLCDEADKEGNISREIQVSGRKACMAVLFKHPKTKERLRGGSCYVQVAIEKEMFTLVLIAGKNYNSQKHENILKSMAQSLQLESSKKLPTVSVERCVDGKKTLLKKGIPVSWTIYDHKRQAVIVQQPVVPRDHRTAESAEYFTSVLVELLKKSKDAAQLIDMSYALILERDLKQAILDLGGWYGEGYSQTNFIPVEIEEFTDASIDAPMTNAVIFYMDALRAACAGVSGVGKKISNMSLRLYWEIPVITIKGECIPRMNCENGQWVGDKHYLEYREISRTPSVLRAPNKSFMTAKQVADELSEKFYKKIEDLEKTEKEYKNLSDKCARSKGILQDFVFPTNFAQCPTLENQVQQIQFEILALENEQKSRREELKSWLDYRKKAEIK